MSNKSGPSNLQRAIVTAISGVTLILIVLIAQLVGVDTPLEEDKPENPPVDDNPNVPVGELVSIPGGYDGGWFQVYFTEPIQDDNFQGSPLEAALVKLLDEATTRIDAALYELNSRPITDALIRAHQRSVQVRVVTDGDAGEEDPDSTIVDLDMAGIPIVSDGTRGGEMHDKFIVVDQTYVWTGSTNLTESGIYWQNNNAILIRSSQLAQNYASEFEELFNKQFGKSSPNTVPNPVITIDGTQIETFFESEGDVPARLAQLFRQAHSVRFMAFNFTDSLRWRESGTDRSIMTLLIDEAAAGQIDVAGIVEATSRRFVSPMVCAGLDVRQDTNPEFLHHKVFIIDESIVVTGSFNFSGGAMDNNDENLLIIHNPALAQVYLEEFNFLWNEWSEPIPAGTFQC